MKSAKKSIKRANKESAFKAMQSHEEKMVKNGWLIKQQFGGDRGCKYEYVTLFCK